MKATTCLVVLLIELCYVMITAGLVVVMEPFHHACAALMGLLVGAFVVGCVVIYRFDSRRREGPSVF